MSAEHMKGLSPRMQRAVSELEGTIRQRYPSATFALARDEDDPQAIHLRATVDVDDPDLVTDLVVERLLELQVDEGLSLYVIPLRPAERVTATLPPHGPAVRVQGAVAPTP